MRTPTEKEIHLLAWVLCLAAAAFFAPFWAPLVLAAWFADLLLPVQRRLERLLRGKRRAAATVVVFVLLVVLLPLAGAALALVPRAWDLMERVREAVQGEGSLRDALLGGAGDDTADLTALTSRYAENAWRAVAAVARASITAALAMFVFVAALYTFLAEGRRAYAWLEARIPIPREALERLALAFRETGRGLIVAGGGTALVQGTVATVAYAAIGVPRAFVLGPLTAVCSIVPAIGTAVIWVPVAIDLALSRDYGRAALVTVAGVIVGVVDNVVRPVLARHGRLRLPTFIVLVSMLGGVAMIGPAGALLGPLIVRLAVEALELVREPSPAARNASA